MIRRIVSWFRIVLPPTSALVPFIILYAICEGFYLWFQHHFGQFQFALDVLRSRDFFLVLAAMSYAAFRVAAFHPLQRTGYRKWLELTPWTSDKPLPLGPVHVVPQDGFVLATLWLLDHDPQISLWYLHLAFLFSNVFLLCASFFPLGQVWMGYVVAFGLGLIVRLCDDPPVATVVAVAVYLVAFLGLQRSLAAFPWPGVKSFEAKQQDLADRLQGKRTLGWPLDWLAPRESDCRISHRDGTAISLLAGWSCYAILSIVSDPIAQRMFANGLTMIVIVVGPLLRLLVYCTYFRSPLGCWARFWTGRWIIPGYDQVFIAPTISFFAGAATASLQFALALRPEISQPLAVTATLLGIFNLGPTYEHWRLRGNHRIMPGTMNRNENVKL